ncbi:MAG: FAD-binding protein [Chitinophagaceae bacterium]
MIIVKHGPSEWHNLHGTVSQKIVDYYDLNNDPKASGLDTYNDTTAGIQNLLKESIASGIPIKPLGGNWSLSSIAATPGILLNTRLLNYSFPIGEGSVVPQYSGSASQLYFAQCGCGIWELNARLRKRNLSLPASGNSNGQTIAGAMATGTHGAGISFGAIQDAAVGLHIIVSPTRHVYIERASQPVMADSFVAKIGAELLRDDELFYAALAGLGAFGFVHGVMLQTEPLYLLEAYLRRVPFDDAFKHQISTLDFTYNGLPYPNEIPFHFQCLLNPYDIDKGAYMTVMYKRPYRTDYTPPPLAGGGLGPGYDTPAIISKVTGILPGTVPLIVTKVVGGNLKPYEKVFGTLGEIFDNTAFSGKVSSAAMGFSPSEILKVVDILMQVNKDAGPFVGLFAFRFVKKSQALMAFTHFDPTCVLELDGVQGPATDRFYNAVWNALEAAGIPYTFHWGKMNGMTPQRLQKMYGNNLQRFTAARSRLMDANALLAFSNDAYKTWGLDAGTTSGGEVFV